ncbi:glycosyltransferase family 24 protein [Hydnomerulius pinastri MD-312]|uniref:Glycosyltransferase family 24 protein n=1 Tax=Hydnomerulius pinastri MD-312 TaxID=994086 RepID=A0A0C9W4S1_9AGAM|nr:glycosyltransferase family 24 protein [Hydnomerulius pinastri MD-312]
MALPCTLLTFTGAVLSALGAYGASPPVTVSLRSSFAASDPLLEAIETVAMEDSSVLFPLLSAFSLPGKPLTPQEAHTIVFDLASTHLDWSALASARARLGLHVASPRLAASAEYYDIHIANLTDSHKLHSPGCASWVDWYGQVVCDADTLLQLANSGNNDISATKPKHLPLDHVHKLPPSLEGPQYTAIHFAEPTAPSFAPLHSALLSLEPKVEYVLRWAKGTGERKDGDLSSHLSGYGVALDLKKMDYLVLDDRNQHQGDSDARETSHGDKVEGTEKLLSEEEILTCVFDSLPYIDEEAEARAKAGEPLSPEEIADLGVKAVQFIMSFSDRPRGGPLYIHPCWNNHHMAPFPSVILSRTLSTSFPLYATSLARKIKISPKLGDEVYDNWAKAAPGINMAWVNGRVISENEGSAANIFGLLRTMQRERNLVKYLVDLGLTSEQAIELLMHPAHSATSQPSSSTPPATSRKGMMRGSAKSFVVQDDGDDMNDAELETKTFNVSPKFAGFLEGLVDASDRQEGGGVVLYWNDIEKDQRYARFSPSIQGLLRVHMMSLFSPMNQIRLNLVNVIFVLDLSQTRSLSLLGSLSDGFVARGFPIRWGFVPEGEGDGLRMARLVYYVEHKYGRDRMEEFIQRLSQAHDELRLTSLSWQLVHEIFNSLHAEDDFAAVAGGDIPILDEATGEDIMTRAQKYARRLGVVTQSETGKGHAFVNGRYIPVSDTLMRQLAGEATTQLQILQEMVYMGDITDADAHLMSTFFYDLPSTLSRRNPYIFAKSTASGGHSLDGTGLQMFNLAELFSNAGFEQKDGSFAVPRDSDALPVTMYIIADFDSSEGVQLAEEALRFITNPAQTRVTFIHNPEGMTTSDISTLLSTLVHTGSLHDVPPSRLLEALSGGEGDAETQKAFSDEFVAGKGLGNADTFGVLQTSRLVTRQLGLEPGQRAILINGRLVGPFDSGSEFVAEDFEMLEAFEIKQRVGRVTEAIDAVLDGGDALDIHKHANLVSTASSIIYADQQPDPSEAGLFDTVPRPRTRNYRLLSDDYTKLEFGDRSTAQSHIALLLDPLSEAAQKWSTVLEHCFELFPEIFVELYFNPTQLSEIPLKRFYRYNAIPQLTYDANGQEIPAQVTFTGLPIEPIYTLSMDVPPSWLVRPREALYDLDNIQLGKLPSEERSSGIQALFALDYLVVEGHARELKTSNPPRGVQLQLISSKDGSAIDDTQVVANLGYLQFKARPGTFRLEIREGRGREIYDLESVGSEGWNSLSVVQAGDELTVMSFDGLTLYPRLARKPGMERVDVLDGLQAPVEESASMMESFVSRMASLFKSKDEGKDTQAVVAQGDGQADINIFTVASGLLYERFASIMIVSVLRNTNSSVKFWFIENFLSPSFLEFIPHMAEEYGFQYELVTYKWPSWLRAQKEKQRIIWAYKILFLDVLFPMDLKKVIFVDADQIVRADLQELVDLNLHGAPYGYTPMGDDNYEMEGFRFWKTGYWHDFLDGRPYHISALYVVDLVRFRQMAAGDILRGQYQMLSADPNSLANLDQDLPNNLQKDVPIYSLNEDWLWCETWCSKDRLSRAKTIDLCQNPMTKEPKLSRARQIPEWEEYDTEIAQFARKLAAQGKIHASVATADSNLLAGGNAPSSSGETPKEDASHPHDEL